MDTCAPRDAADTTTLRTGRSMPVMGLGTWQLTRDTAGAVANAFALGYRMIDTSGDYGTEPGVGQALRRAGIPRAAVYLVTKVEEHEDAYASTKERLRALGVERVDLVLVHRPPPDAVGVELWQGLQRARDEGLTVDIGVSNYSTEAIDALVLATGEMPVVNQIEWTPFGWSPAMLDRCRRDGIVIQAYSPLTRGERLDDPLLVEIASAYGKTPAQVLLRWNLQLGTVPLPKANEARHQRENLAVFDFTLDDEDMRRLGARNEDASALGTTLSYV